jgi:hypothetical protein
LKIVGNMLTTLKICPQGKTLFYLVAKYSSWTSNNMASRATFRVFSQALFIIHHAQAALLNSGYNNTGWTAGWEKMRTPSDISWGFSFDLAYEWESFRYCILGCSTM